MESGPPPSAGPSETDRSVATDRRFGSLLEAADVATFRVAADGTIRDVNAAFASLTGYDRDELLETPFAAIVEDTPALASLVPDETAGPVSTPLQIRTNAGTLLACTVHLERVDGDGRETRLIDGIVERRPTTAATDSPSGFTYGKTFEALANALPDGIIVLDTNSDIRYANPAVERILGYAPDELVGSNKVTIIPPRLRQAHLDALARYLETGERNLNWTYVELPGQHEAGHEVPLGVSLNDFTYDGERYFVGLFRDISPRKEAERTLREKVVQLESVAYLGRRALETADVDDLLAKTADLAAASLDVDSCTVLEEVDRREIGRLRVRAHVGSDVLEIEDERTLAATIESLAAETLAAGDPVVVEDVATDSRFGRSSQLFEHGVRSAVGVPVGSPAEPWGVLTIAGRHERAFAAHDVDFLESVATILTTAIERQEYERRLTETVDELEASNERLEQFAYAASHDLQEPLRMVSNYLRLVERRYADELDADGEEFIEFAVDGAERMKTMIDGLLEYSRIDTQGEPFEPVDLDAVLEDVTTDLQLLIEREGAEITAEPLPDVRGDPRQLRQLFQNLLSNAIQYSGDEPPRIDVTVERAGSRWEISVHDDGIGIDPDDQEQIFRVFQRLHSREEYDGTGIGLALCRRIVERHGGDIRVESEPYDGSTFTVTLPAADAQR